MTDTHHIYIKEQAFDANKFLADFQRRNQHAGAIVNFIGQVRNKVNHDAIISSVDSLYLEHIPRATEKSMIDIRNEAHQRWALLDSLIVHRIGLIYAGDAIVLVAAAAPHRRAAFEATDFMMDYLKSEALFWKKEMTQDTETWIEPRAQDYADKKRWDT